MKPYALMLSAALAGSIPVVAAYADQKSADEEVNAPLVSDLPSEETTHALASKQPFSGRYPVEAQSIPAEIVPVSGKVNAAALALQRLGFRIRHIGVTISVEGPEALWKSVFDVSFETRKKRVVSEIEGGDVTYRSAITEKMKIPADLEQSIADVAFMEPPGFY